MSGVLVGVGLTVGVASGLRTRQPEVSRIHPEQDSGTRHTNPDTHVGSNKADELSAKIERLHRWSEGKEPTLKREDAFKLLEEWSVVDPQAALTFVINAPRIPRRNQAYAIPLAVLCARDSRTVIAWILQNIPDNNARTEIAEAVIRRAKEKAPVTALELADAPNIPVRTEYFGELMGLVARTQPQFALQQFDRLTATGQETALGPMLNFWAQTNPEDALAWYISSQRKLPRAAALLIEGCMKNGSFRVGDLIQRLGLKTTDEADAVLRQLSYSGVALDVQDLKLFTPSAMQNAAENIGRNMDADPDRIVRLMKAAMPLAQQSDAVFESWANWMESDRKAALDWLQQQPDRQLADDIVRRLQQRDLARDPTKALASLPTIADQEQRKRVATNALLQLAYDKPEAAIAWLAQNKTESLSAETYSVLAGRYLRCDDATAMDWIAKLGAGEAKDAALRVAANYWSDKEIDFATTSMAAIGDAQKRQACMFDLYRQQSRKDAATADQWLVQQGLSGEVRQSWKALANR